MDQAGNVSAMQPAAASTWAVVQAPDGARGFDVDDPLTPQAAQEFFDNGFSFVVRYVSRVSPGSSSDLTAHETSTIVAAGLALMVVQHVALSPWTPNAGLGQQYGTAAAANAVSAGLPPGVTVWLDLEGVAHGVSAGDVIAYCNAWFAAVQQAGYRPGIYVGADAVLDGDALYNDLSTEMYWKSGSNVPHVAVRGYCMVQSIDPANMLAGYGYDTNMISPDALNGTPFWLRAQPSAVA